MGRLTRYLFRNRTAAAYSLQTQGDKTLLTFEIGDFSPLPDAQDYREKTVELVNTAKEKIKLLSEQE